MVGLLIFLMIYYLAAAYGVAFGYHRYLAHRSFELPTWLKTITILIGLPAGTPLQWAGNHRRHHMDTDRPGDPHSPVVDGFWFAHVGWYLGSKNPILCLLYSFAGPLRMLFDGWWRPRTNQEHVGLARDVAADPVLRFLSNKWIFLGVCWLHVLLPFTFVYWWHGIIGVASLWATLVAIYNVSDGVDSFGHLFGERPFEIAGAARDHWILACLTLGDGWHASHHAFPRSACHGLLPGKVDLTYQLVKFLARVGLASSVVLPTPEEVNSKLKTSYRSEILVSAS